MLFTFTFDLLLQKKVYRNVKINCNYKKKKKGKNFKIIIKKIL